jgi:hypothetical protein
MSDESLSYSKLPDQIGRRNIRRRIFSILVLAFGIFTVLDCAYIEFANYRAGYELPFAPLPPGGRDTLREAGTSEMMYRINTLERAGDPLWRTRPLNPAEQVSFTAWKKVRADRNALIESISFACLLIPLIPMVLIGTIVLFFMERSMK